MSKLEKEKFLLAGVIYIVGGMPKEELLKVAADEPTREALCRLYDLVSSWSWQEKLHYIFGPLKNWKDFITQRAAKIKAVKAEAKKNERA